MAIQVIHAEERERWDDAVRRLPNYEVFYLNDYLRAFELHGDGEPMLAVYTNGEDYAVNAVFRRDVADDCHFAGKLERGRYFDLSSPYGYGGFIGQVRDWERLSAEWEEHCREQGYICEFVRFELFGDYRKHYGGAAEFRTHNVVRNLEMPVEEIWMDFKQKVRKNVKRARSNGLQVVRDETGERLEDFLGIYYSTMDRNNASDGYYFSRAFFETLNQMQGNCMYFFVLLEERVISAELVIYGAENCYSYLGGTDSDYFELRPNDLLKYEIICWAKEKGLKNFVLGGGYGADDGIFQYKACLAPRGIVEFYIGKKIFNQEMYRDLCARRGIEQGNGMFFPEYRSV